MKIIKTTKTIIEEFNNDGKLIKKTDITETTEETNPFYNSCGGYAVANSALTETVVKVDTSNCVYNTDGSTANCGFNTNGGTAK